MAWWHSANVAVIASSVFHVYLKVGVLEMSI